MEHEERAGRLVRRIESFSDLVIGFSLALLALTLKVPPTFNDLLVHPWWLIAYAWTFAVICNVWYMHQRLFTYFFLPTAGTIIGNFALLSMIGLVVFFVQVFVHFIGVDPDQILAFTAYFTATGCAFLLAGALYAHGLRKRWDQLDVDLRAAGLVYALRGLVGGTALLIGVAIVALRGPHNMNDAWTMAIIGAFGGVSSRIIATVISKRQARVERA